MHLTELQQAPAQPAVPALSVKVANGSTSANASANSGVAQHNQSRPALALNASAQMLNVVGGSPVTVGPATGARPVTVAAAPRQAKDDSPDSEENEKRRSKLLTYLFGMHTSPNGTTIVELEDFMPQCLAHVHRVIRRVDRWYTDEQLGTLLQNECDFDETFLSYEDGFEHREACEEFGNDLTQARYEELSSGSTKGYEDFCEKYHEHVMKGVDSTTTVEEEKEKTVREGSEWFWGQIIVHGFIAVFIVLLLALACVKLA